MFGSIFFCSSATAAALLRAFAASTRRRSFAPTVSAAKAVLAIRSVNDSVVRSVRICCPGRLKAAPTLRQRFSSVPELSPSFSCFTPTLSSIVTSRFVIGVWSAYFRWRPPFIFPAAPPTTRFGSGK